MVSDVLRRPRRWRGGPRWDVGSAGGATTGGCGRSRRPLSHTGFRRGNGDDRPARVPVRATKKTCPAAAPRFAGPTGGWVAATRGRGRRQPTGSHAAVATRCARDGHSPSFVMIASGDLISMEGIICIGWRLPGSSSNRGIESGQRFPPILDKVRRRGEAASSPASTPCLHVSAFRSARRPGPRVP